MLKVLSLPKFLGLLALVLLFAIGYFFFEKNKENAFVIVIPSYNNKDWYKRNLDSVFSQDYHNFRVIYVDDASCDGTGELVKKYIKEKGQEANITLIQNEKRSLALANIYKAVWMCDPREIVILVDGDDWLVENNQILAYLNKVYSNPDVWMTYGQYIHYPQETMGYTRLVPQEVIEKNSMREYPGCPSHLRTFYAGLFQKINKDDLLYNGLFYPMAGDVPMICSIMEIAGTHSRFIPDVLYVYNTTTAIHDHKVNPGLQCELDAFARKQKKYLPVKKPW